MRRSVAALMLAMTLSLCGAAWADGYPDQPIKKSVRKVKAPRPPRRAKKAAVRKAPAPKPKPAAPGSLQQGVALAEQERYGAAMPWLRKAIMENRRSAAAWYWYGVCHEKTGRFYEAQYFYTRAVECDPTFEPLSRVVAWPNNGEKTPVWDPKRPARVYPVETAANGVTVIPPASPQARIRPTRPQADPSLPKVPVYVPPQPGDSPLDGGKWNPAIYVPPTMSEAALESGGGDFPAYIPPESPKGYAVRGEPIVTENGFVYQPPAPNQAVAPSPAPNAGGAPAYTPPSRPGTQARPATLTAQPEPKKTDKKPAAPRRAAKRPRKAAGKTTPKRGAKPAAPVPEQPKTTAQPQAPQQPEPKIEPAIPPVIVKPQPRVEELPPVGQSMPEGTVEAPSIPPVGSSENGTV